jgi:Holliday junction resolvase RusA-like endonuclease
MSKRIKNSIGVSATNNGKTRQIEESKYIVDKERKCHLIDVIPMGAVRMTKSDKWKQPDHPDPKKRRREAVTRYFDFKNTVTKECNKLGINLSNCLDVVFFIPMPESWSLKKKEKMNGMPHKSRPDIDNILKGLMDALRKEDGDIWSIKAEKRYAFKGSILIYD